MSEASGKTARRRRFTVDSLFVDTTPRATGVVDLPNAKEIQLARIVSDPFQPRHTFDNERLEELAASMRREGVLQPIAVRYESETDQYVILHGERRWRAARLAGLESIPAIVREVPEERRLIQQLMENVVREDLNAIDRAAALRALKTQMSDAPWEQVAEAVGIRRSRLFQLLGTEKLPESVQDELRSGRMSEKQTRVLQGLPEIAQETLARMILHDGLAQPTAHRLARAVRSDPSFSELDEPEVIRRFSAMREAVEASASKSRERSSLSDNAAAFRQLLPESARGEDVTPDHWTLAERRDLDEAIHTLARALEIYKHSEVRSAERKEINTRLRALRTVIDGLIGRAPHV
ncbi:MAG TPA: ParB/RepB/Spo0J family partition protein [Nitrolancea sp.]|nr:ParB/RepB/Spo0J family partition protein [Nitrolancea sp.]